MKNRLRYFLGVSALVGLGASASSDAAEARDFSTLSFEDLGAIRVPTVVGASKFEQKITEAPSAVSILTREDIQEFGYRTLGDLLRGVRGFYVTNNRAYNFTGLRGLNRPGDFGGRVLINIDGHRLNEPIYDSAFTDTDLLVDADLIERVEVIRGPGSSLYGNNAFAAVINVVTRRGRDVDGWEASAMAGSFDTSSGRLSFGRKFQNGVEVMVSGSYLDSGGQPRITYQEFAATNGGVAQGIDGTVAKSAYAAVSWGDFTLSGGFIDRRKNVPTAQYGAVFNDPRLVFVDVRSYGELKYDHIFDADWRVQARGYYDTYRYEATIPFDYPPVTLNRDYAASRWAGIEMLVSKTVRESHRLTLGGEFRRDLEVSLQNFDIAPRVTYVNAQRTSSSVAVFAQDEVKLGRAVVLNGGVRYDHFSAFGDTVNPRGALIVTPWSEGTLKFLHGRAFRAPNSYETDYIAPTFKRNPNLSPESTRSFEFVYEQGLPSGWRLSGSLFLNQIQGLIGQSMDSGDGLNYFANLDAVESRGFELEVEGRWAHGLRSRLSFTYADARDKVTRRTLDNSPRHLGKASFVLPMVGEKIFAGFELQAMSRRTTVQGGEVGAFMVANATLFSRRLAHGLEVTASVHNLFDRKFADPTSSDFIQDTIVQDGRALRLKLTLKR